MVLHAEGHSDAVYFVLSVVMLPPTLTSFHMTECNLIENSKCYEIFYTFRNVLITCCVIQQFNSFGHVIKQSALPFVYIMWE